MPKLVTGLPRYVTTLLLVDEFEDAEDKLELLELNELEELLNELDENELLELLNEMLELNELEELLNELLEELLMLLEELEELYELLEELDEELLACVTSVCPCQSTIHKWVLTGAIFLTASLTTPSMMLLSCALAVLVASGSRWSSVNPELLTLIEYTLDLWPSAGWNL